MSALVPALAARYLELDPIRHDYPLLLLPDADPVACAAPLATLLDEAIDAIGAEAGRPDTLRRDAYRIEARVKRLLEEGDEAQLHALWRRAVTQVTDAAAPDEGLLRVGEALAERLPDGTLLGCTSGAAAVLLEHAAAAVRRSAAVRDLGRLEEMATTLDEALAGERARSPEAASATSLRATLGDPASSGLDPDALGRVLAASGAFRPEPSERAERLHNALHAVEEARRDVERSQAAPAAAATTIAAGMAQWRGELRRRVAVARAAHLARLALDTRYRPERDGRAPVFATTDLTAEQLAELPPTLVILDSERLDDAERSRLLELLSGETPLTVLLAVRRLSGPGGEWLARIGSAALALGDAFVVQAALSQLPHLTAELAAALSHAGPGLIAIYTGCETPGDGVPAYLRAAAAVESRAFPSFVVDPAAGVDLAGRLSLAGNPQPDRPWPVHPLFYEAADGSPVEEEAAFTAADFLALETPSDAALAIIADGAGDDRIAPVADLLNGADPATARRVPYLLLVDDEGRLQRAVAAPAAVASARRAARQWQRLQALAAPPPAAPAAPAPSEEAGAEPPAVEASPSPEARAAAAAQAEAAPAPTSAADPDAPWIDSASCTTCEECVQRNSAMFAYNEAKQAYIKDITAGTYRQLVEAAEVCPVAIIHPGKPRDPNEPGLEELVARAAALA